MPPRKPTGSRGRGAATQGKDGQQVPEMDEAFVKSVSDRYIELFENITGQKFVKEDVTPADIEKKIIESLKTA